MASTQVQKTGKKGIQLSMLNKRGGLQGFRIEGASGSQVDAVVLGLNHPIRNLGEEEIGLMVLELQRVAAVYGARKKVDDLVLREAVTMIEDKFGMLGIGEIGAAFRAAAAGELRGVNMEMYGGELNVKIIGSVLGGWRDFRRGVVAELVRREDDLLKLARDAQRRVELNAKYEADFPELVAGADFERWEDVPVHWYDTAVRLGMLILDVEQKRFVWERAQELAKQSLNRELVGTKGAFSRRNLRKAIESGTKVREVGKVIGMKLCVWGYLLGKGFVGLDIGRQSGDVPTS